MPTDLPGDPEQRPADAGAVAAELRSMSDAADLAIARQLSAPDPASARHAAAVFDVYAVMRPRFGPANAWLYQERDRKLAAMARSLGVTEPVPPTVDTAVLDTFFARVDELSAALRARGLVVESSSVTTGSLDWQPAHVRGLALRVVDRGRTIVAAQPYSTSPGVAVNPAFTADLFPPAELSTSENLTARVQPGALLGAIDGVLMLAAAPQHAADLDDGGTRAAVIDACFGPGAAQPLPDLAVALGAQQAVLERGVLSVTATKPRGAAALERPTGAYALQWTVVDGTRAERAVTSF